MDATAFTGENRATVEAHLRRLDHDALAAFVADLWDARGFDTERDGAVVMATRDGETLLVGTGDRTTAGGRAADIVVDPGRGSSYEGIESLDAADLAEQLWYAIERPVARALCERHLGAEPTALSLPVSERVRRALSVRAALTVLLAAAAVAVVTLSVPTGLDALIGGSDEATPTPMPTASDTYATPVGGPGVSAVSLDTPAGPTGSTEGPEDESFDAGALPPGVTTDGIEDIEALGRAHAEIAATGSYGLRMKRYWTELRDRQVVQVERDIDAAVDGEQYRVDTTQFVAGERTRTSVLYHDGENSFVTADADSGPEFRRVAPLEQQSSFPTPPRRVTASLVETRLSTPTTTLRRTVERDGLTFFRVTGSGQPDWSAIGAVQEYNVTALVRPDGFVREVHVRYTVRDGMRLVDIRRTLRYGDLGDATVEPPAWYQPRSEQNETGG
jgi:hypothetical protein